MQLLDTSENPLPPGSETTWVVTEDGVRLRTAFWPRLAGRPQRGTVLVFQGRAEFIEKYFETVGELRERGFAVAAFDWRGQGGSDRALADRRRGHVRRFEDFRLDAEAVLRHLAARGDPGPVVGLAHSMGGCIALTGAAEGWLPLDRLVVTSPMLALRLVRRPRLVRATAWTLARLGLRTRFVPGGPACSISTLPFPGNRLCTDPVRYGRNAAVATALGWGAIGAPTVGWLLAAYAAMDRLAAPGMAGRIRMPVLIVAAGADPVCATEATERFAAELRRGTLVVVPGARHEVLMETDALRQVFWEAFDRFLGSGSAEAPAPAPQRASISSTVA
ncbi:alpha/beta hydrolase [Enterovirga sp.]|jgi:lysophospholipase|uniref:alpha/beta fold hydrolase n=1 Tax=Enterovirga sp. TaxID=2026350 RepID=UPI00260DB3E4|nr:alpha/beta hydrolase [Enterovirga sp.]MDB5589914.1 alpha/beta hydrolase fold [Enterovirga sp.]